MSVSFWQILIVVLVLLILFGPSRISSLGRSLGEAIRGFKKGLDEEEKKEEKVSNEKPSSNSALVNETSEKKNSP